MKSSSVFSAAAAAILSVTVLASCDGLKEAMTAHVDTVAHVGSQELSVSQLAKLVNEVKAPPQKDIATAIANTWVDYQLLGQSAASGDTSIDNKTVDEALWAAIASIKARKYTDVVSKNWGTADTAMARKMYDNGEILAASHILLLTRGKPPAEAAAAKTKANALRGQITAANFADLAKKNSQDPGSATRGGSLGVFAKGMMVPQFEQALISLKPGEISPVIETEYGYHIIRRPTFDEVKGEVMSAAGKRSMQMAESTFVANLQKNGQLIVHTDAAAPARAVIDDPEAHLDDGTTLATSVAGNFTAGRLAQWWVTFPPQAQMQQKVQIQSAPDSMVRNLIKNFVTNELVLRAADSAKLGPTPDELAGLRKQLMQARGMAWMQLGVAPNMLADSGRSVTERERVASARIDRYIDNLAVGRAPFAEVPPPLSQLLRQQFKASVNPAGIDHALEEAKKLRTAQDSAQKATEPSTAVPMPGAMSPADSAKAAGANPAPTAPPAPNTAQKQ